MKRILVLMAVCAATLACRSYPNYPVTESSKTMPQLNEHLRGTAPVTNVTSDRIRNARSEPNNWMTYYGAYDGQRFSALDQINAGNVKGLRPAWQFQFAPTGIIPAPATFSFEAAPIVVDGVMYVSGWDGYLWCLDAATGELLWQYQHQIPLDTPLCCGNVNRGVAVANGRVYMATQNGYLLALDATNGKLVWQTAYADVRAGESATMAPLVVKNLIIAGASGGEYGVRGHIDAFDLTSGQRVWRRYTVPAPGEPGSETWTGDSWQRGGGTTWITGTYDPELDLVYWGTGNPGPLFDDSPRRGTNLYTNSVLAIDPDDGTIRWHYQFTPDDVWDYDGVNENILFDQGGRRLLAHFDRNGYLFILDRTNGQLVRAVQYGDKVTWGEIDASGRVTQRLKPTKEGTVICPGPAGAKEWPHASYNPRTGFLYAPIVDACATFRLVPQQFREGMFYLAGDADVTKHEQRGHVRAIDPATGRQVWSWDGPQPIVASTLSTGGDLVFAGEPNGHFNAYDARTGAMLWTYQTGNGIHSNPVTYSVNGKQYIAVPTGWGGWLEGFAPEMMGAPRGTSLVVFALP
ncbi:MAG: PQQ-dependent dehydrogenase, methanol/ethanol family [Acidobacteriota bacterium]|nr:PQQ-dependent dehydrogenase, methanol/ethanol family [Acidobacteriota bacterium]